MPPTLANGKICYIEMPTTDIARSAEFYQRVFGWNVRKRGDGRTAFDDTVGEVSGAWVTGRPPATNPGLLFYVMVDDVDQALTKAVSLGGKKLIGPLPLPNGTYFGWFADLEGNTIGVYAEGKK